VRDAQPSRHRRRLLVRVLFDADTCVARRDVSGSTASFKLRETTGNIRFLAREQSRFGTSALGTGHGTGNDLSTTYVTWIQRGSSAEKKKISPIR